jgi:azobenzene reductase
MKITMIAGSNRKNATSTQLLSYIAKKLKQLDVHVEMIDLRHLPLPLFSPDDKEIHPNAAYLRQTVKDADGLIFATPEYHGSLSGVLKNALDYLNSDLVSGKVVLSISSAGGPLAISSLTHLQTIVRNLHGINCPEWISLGYDAHSFDEEGIPTNEKIIQRVDNSLQQLLMMTKKLHLT